MKNKIYESIDDKTEIRVEIFMRRPKTEEHSLFFYRLFVRLRYEMSFRDPFYDYFIREKKFL